MKKKFCLLILILLILTIIPIRTKAINQQNIVELTIVSDSVNNITFDFTLIHPNEYISYGEKNFSEEIEEKLKEDYDLVLVNFSLSEASSGKFNLYQFKNNFKLTVDNESVESIDFYDTEFSPSGSAYWSSDTLDYKTSASVGITGYLLFPKTIDENSKYIELEGNYNSLHSDDGYTLYSTEDWIKKNGDSKLEYKVSWDFEKIDRLIDILKD